MRLSFTSASQELHMKYFDVAAGRGSWKQATAVALPEPPKAAPVALSSGTLFLVIQVQLK